MVIEYTYEVPDVNAFFKTLLWYLKKKNENDILNILAGGHCHIHPTTQYSRRVWNMYSTAIYFSIKLANLELVNEDIQLKENIQRTLIVICNEIMPKETGFDVTYVKFSPLLEDKIETSLTQDLEEISSSSSPKNLSQILPGDIVQKAKDMTEVYSYLYCIENSLRLFIENVARDHSPGDNFMNALVLPRQLQKNIADRKKEERNKRWLPFRGESDLFYLDFKDFSSIIQNNWELFADYFSSQDWIVPKIKDLVDIRNLVMHNSYVDRAQRELIRVYFHNILKQIDSSKKFKHSQE